MQQTKDSELTLFFFGVLVDTPRIIRLEERIRTALLPLGKRKFHSRKTYRQEKSPILLQELNDLIVREHLPCICFPFVASWLERPELAVLKSFTLIDMPEVSSSNYRSQAWLLFLHVLNHNLNKTGSIGTCNVVLDKDWLSPERFVVYEARRLNRLGAIFPSTPKIDPLLCLADHVGYLFQNFKKNASIENGRIILRDDAGLITAGAVSLYRSLIQNGLWTYLDVWQWIDDENLSTEQSN